MRLRPRPSIKMALARHFVQQVVTLFTRKYTSVSILEGGRKLKILPSSEEHGYHALWLRHNCQCEKCLSSSNQKTVTGYHLKRDLAIDQASVKGWRCVDHVLLKIFPCFEYFCVCVCVCDELVNCISIPYCMCVCVDGKVLIDWKSKIDSTLNHTGSVCLEWLKDNSYSASSLKKKSEEMVPVIGTDVSMYVMF